MATGGETDKNVWEQDERYPMESSRLREPGSRLPARRAGVGPSLREAEVAQVEGAHASAGGGAPAGGWGGPCRLNRVAVFPSRLEEADTARLPVPRGAQPRTLPNDLPCGKSCGSQAPGTQGSAIQDNRFANKVPRESSDLAIQTH